MKAAPDRIDTDEDGVDDVVLSGEMVFRLERMDDTVYWMRLYRKGKPDIVFSIYSDTQVLISVEED